ncbi:MAG: hypothetical protein HOQ11_14910 [Gemmatimonadaceae bacterium]|nr:hypothetical protein [Gemmatimonadaceae bacterium]NUQ94850.1 hypothetical protein [Gemmatimonadaceae bacterium]NUR17906.1 hypothetical protein [Gemmatimonadaceae bacterium]NUS98690.1 hypothetical protein [Gemmatimonadaceae bacterium]
MNHTRIIRALAALLAAAPIALGAQQVVKPTVGRRVPPKEGQTPTPRAVAPRADTVSRAYQAGAAIPGHVADFNLVNRWTRAATASTLSYDELVGAWSEIAFTAFAYDQLLGRIPTDAELRRHVAAMKGGAQWTDLWREVATSPERDRSYGFYAPAPMSHEQVEKLYGIRSDLVSVQGEQCFGGVGPNCDMPKEIKDVDWTFPRWHDEFTLPNGQKMAWVDVGVVVGSILHDNTCLSLRPVSGHFCADMVAGAFGDFVKTGDTPAGMEWNKAVYNVRDHRGWTATFGPYPIGATARYGWYDDLRPVAARPAKMAPILSMLTLPSLTVPFTGQERRSSARLQAPPGTKLDQTDVAYCQSRAFSATAAPPLFAPEGTCR